MLDNGSARADTISTTDTTQSPPAPYHQTDRQPDHAYAKSSPATASNPAAPHHSLLKHGEGLVG